MYRLSALGNVIGALTEKGRQHIPYRGSKLTRLLQDSLGGNTRTVICTNVSTDQDDYDETHSTLQFAARCINVQNHARRIRRIPEFRL